MKKLRTTILILCVILLVPMAALACNSADIYHEEICTQILKNMAKIKMEKSGLANAKIIGTMARQKAIFLSKNINMLAAEMAAQKVGFKNYQIQYFLNKKFHDYLRLCACHDNI